MDGCFTCHLILICGDFCSQNQTLHQREISTLEGWFYQVATPPVASKSLRKTVLDSPGRPLRRKLSKPRYSEIFKAQGAPLLEKSISSLNPGTKEKSTELPPQLEALNLEPRKKAAVQKKQIMCRSNHIYQFIVLSGTS